MGGELLQKVNRDTQKFAMKASAACVNGEWRDVYKDPITDSGKRSKKGRLALVRNKMVKLQLCVKMSWQAVKTYYGWCIVMVSC
jgi:nicotinic acid phosphoribosyltransferase